MDQIESYFARRLGKPDPNALVNEKDTDRMPTPYDLWALRSVTFTVERGETVGIMGRNGSGKSTLLKILSRITAPTRGSAEIHGRVASLLEVGTGFHQELTGKENVYLNGSILGLRRHEIEARYDEIVAFSEIGQFMDTPVKRYSSGMRVRLAFAVAAHLEPDILILDEVLAVGDAAFQEKCLDKIDQTRNKGTTILFVSHSADSVRRLCTRGLVLAEGNLVCDASAEAAVAHYNNSLNPGEGAAQESAVIRRSLLIGKVARLLSTTLRNGTLVFDAPVQTEDSVQHVDVGWFSDTRLSAGEKTHAFQVAPEICVFFQRDCEVDKSITRKMWLLSRKGSAEQWRVLPDGRIVVKRAHQNAAPLVGSVPENILV